MVMRYRLFGRTGLRVSELCLGTMTFGEDWGWGAAKKECAQILEAYAQAGGNFVDTANMYTNGASERILGELIASDRDRWVVATKYALSMRPNDPNGGGGHRKSLVQALEASLRRLGTDYIDVYWVHVWDAFTPVEEVVRALDDVVSSGKALYVGISDTPAWLVSQAVTLADLRGWTRFAGVQVPYNLLRRDVERDLLPMAEALELAVTAWEPLSGGLLSGRHGNDRKTPAAGTRISDTQEYGARVNEHSLAVADAVNTVATERGVSPAQIAIAWVRAQQRPHGTLIPIIGARRREQLHDNLGAVEIELTAAERERLDKVSRIDLGFPHNFEGRAYAYGNTFTLTDNHRSQLYTTVDTPSIVAQA